MNAFVKPSQALTMFRHGLDTVEIAKRLGVSEANVSRYIWVARSREKRLPADFLNKDGQIKRIAP